MIVRREGDRLWLIRQTDHAALSGVMAAHWGGETVPRPVEPMRTAQAIAGHDEGWLAWERTPRINRKTDRPFGFTEMPLDDALTIWYLSPKIAGERDPYAGLLVSLHGTRLLERRLADQRDPPPERERIRRYLLDQETLRERLQIRLKRDEPEAADGLISGLDYAYRILRICDGLSLRFCLGPSESSRTLGPPPLYDLTDAVAARLHVRDPQTLSLDPWPFDAESIRLALPAVSLPDRRFTTYKDLESEILGSKRFILEFHMQK
jgi:hypothetical protein